MRKNHPINILRKQFGQIKPLREIARKFDTLGLPHAVTVATADVTDRQGSLHTFKHCKSTLQQVQSVLTDSSYTDEAFAQGG